MIILILFISLFVALGIGIPVAYSIGISGVLTLFIFGEPNTFLVLGGRLFRGLESFPLMAVPFFILSGELMGVSITRKLIDFASSLVGHIRGGLSQINTLASLFFGGLTGAGVADTAALGSVLIPAMEKKGYKTSFAAAVTGATSTLGPIVPPSIPMVVYALAVGGGVSIGALFLSGIIPAILITIAFMILSYIIAIKDNHPIEGKFSFKKVLTTFKSAILSLLMPIIILGGIISGFVTPTEAAAIAVFYALIIGFFVYKDITIKNLPIYFLNTAIVTSVVMLLIGIGRLLSWVLTINQIPIMLENLLHSFSTSSIVFLLIIAFILFIVGLFMEGSAAIIMLAPVLAPISVTYGIDPIHFGFLMVMNLMLGMITPPVGVILFVASGIANISVEEILIEIWPYILVAYGVLLLVILFPEVTLFVPRLFGF